jgi:hypothetical protein
LHTEAREPRLLSGKVILTGGFCLATAWLQYLLTSAGSCLPGTRTTFAPTEVVWSNGHDPELAGFAGLGD